MVYIIIAIIFYTAAVLFSTAATRAIDSVIVSAVVNTISFILPLILAIPMLDKKLIYNSRFGLIMALLGGVAITVFTLAINKSFSVNKVGIVTPLIYGGTIFLSTLLSTYFFKEKISFVQGVGLAILAIGFSVITYARYTGK